MASPFGDVASGLFGNIFNSVLLFAGGIFVIAGIGSVMYYFIFYKRKFDIEVKIVSERAEDKNQTIFDKAAIITDRKTKVRYLRLWKLKIELPLINFNVLQSAGGKDYLELYRTSDDMFYFLTPPHITKDKIIGEDGKIIPYKEQEQNLIKTDIAYWNIKRKEANKGMFDTENMLMKLLPFIPQIIGGVITMFCLYILMDHLPDILSQLSNLASTINQQQTAQVITYG